MHVNVVTVLMRMIKVCPNPDGAIKLHGGREILIKHTTHRLEEVSSAKRSKNKCGGEPWFCVSVCGLYKTEL